MNAWNFSSTIVATLEFRTRSMGLWGVGTYSNKAAQVKKA